MVGRRGTALEVDGRLGRVFLKEAGGIGKVISSIVISVLFVSATAGLVNWTFR
jgi:hypothetical protein